MAATEADAWFMPGRFAVFLAAILFANFPTVFLGTHTFFYRDYLNVVFPYAQYNHDSLWHGELPLWNPLNHCGVPYLAQWQTFVLYPGWWIFLPFDPSWALGIFTLAHLYVAGVTMYFLAHRWSGSRLGACLAGIVYTFNGLTQNSLTWPHIIAALAWAPLVILLVEKACKEGGKKVFIAALIGALQMLSGAPEQILFTWFILLVLTLAGVVADQETRAKMILRFGGIVVLVALLCAAQLLPFLDLIAHSQRSAQFATSEGARPGGLSWSVPGWGWANLLVPYFYNFQSPSGVYFQSQQFLTSSYYFGVGALFLTAWALWRVRHGKVFLSGIILLGSLVLALGEHGHVYHWIHAVFPPIGYMRYPVKFLFLAVILMPLLVAFAVAHWQSHPLEEFVTERRRLAILGFAMLALIAAILWFAHAFPLYPGLKKYWPMVFNSGLTRAAFLIVMLVALLLRTEMLSPRNQLFIAIGLVICFWLDLQTHTRPSPNPVAPRWTYTAPVVKMTPKPAHGQSRALVTLNTQTKFLGYQSPDPKNDVLYNRMILLHQCNLIDGIPVVGGAHTLLISESDRVASLLLTTNETPSAGLADFLGVSQLSDEKKLEWKPRESFLPLVTAGQEPLFADEKSTFAAVAQSDFDPRSKVFLPLEARVTARITNAAAAKIISTNVSSQRIEVNIESSSGTWLVLAQTFYHHWRAYVDDVPVRLWKANYGFQAVEVPKGAHRVKVVYQDRLFLTSAVVSLLTWIACSIAVFSKRNFPSQRQPE